MHLSPTELTRRVWTAPPSQPLRPYVRSYIAQAIDVPPGEDATLTVAATVYPVLFVTYAGTVHTDYPEAREGRTPPAPRPDERPIPEVSLTGPIPVAFSTTLVGRPRGFFVQLEPAAPLALFGVEGPAYRLGLSADRLVRPGVAPRLEPWARDVAAAGDEGAAFPARVALTERLLGDLLGADVTERAAFAARMAARVIETDGTRRVRDVADDLGVSESTLRRRFGADLGLAPKPFSAVVRFRHALAYLHAHPGASWAQVADRFGYADQSHLIRDYRRFAGVVPSRWDDAERFIDLTFGILESKS